MPKVAVEGLTFFGEEVEVLKWSNEDVVMTMDRGTDDGRERRRLSMEDRRIQGSGNGVEEKEGDDDDTVGKKFVTPHAPARKFPVPRRPSRSSMSSSRSARVSFGSIPTPKQPLDVHLGSTVERRTTPHHNHTTTPPTTNTTSDDQDDHDESHRLDRNHDITSIHSCTDLLHRMAKAVSALSQYRYESAQSSPIQFTTP